MILPLPAAVSPAVIFDDYFKISHARLDRTVCLQAFLLSFHPLNPITGLADSVCCITCNANRHTVRPVPIPADHRMIGSAYQIFSYFPAGLSINLN